MATAESLQRLASGLLERMGRRLGDGKGRRGARVQPRPTRWRSGGWGRAGVWLGEEQGRSKAALRERETRNRGWGSQFPVLEILRVLAAGLTWHSLYVYIGEGDERSWVMLKCMHEGERLRVTLQSVCAPVRLLVGSDVSICILGQGWKDDHIGYLSKQKTRRDCNRNILCTEGIV